MSKQKIAFDMVLNILATAIPIAVLQLVVLPILASYVDSDEYGLAITLVALLSLCPETLGNVMNNVRLLHNENGEGCKPQGDYSVMTTVLAVLGVVIVLVVCIAYRQRLDVTCVLMAITAGIVVLRGYLSVAYRLILNFKAILFNNIFLSIGYLVGLGAFVAIGDYWALNYLFGHLASLLYIIATTTIWKDPFTVTQSLKGLSVEAALLLVATLLGRATSYADRLVLFPLLGGYSVSIYYIATLFGKIISSVITPINSVVLSYLSRMHKKPDRVFWMAFAAAFAACVVAYVVTILIAEPILAILYPQYVEESMKYVWLVTLAAYVQALVTVVNPFVLKFFPMKWQPILNGVFFVFYLAISLLLLSMFGLWGFCIGVLVADVAKLLMLLVIYTRGSTKEQLEGGSQVRVDGD